MGQLVNITDITSAVAGTLGVSTLTGWTRYIANSSELPDGSTSTAYLVQSDPAVAPTLRLDATAAVFAGGNTYQRISYWVKLMKYDQEVGTAPTTHALHSGSGFQFSFAGNGVFFKPQLRWVAPESTSSRYTGALGGFVLETPVGSFGTESNIGHVGSACSYNNSGVADQTSNYAAPNFPIAQWVRLDFLADISSTKRCKMFINGQMTTMNSLKVSTDPCIDWTFTFPVITGFRWAIERMSSWGDTNPANDTGLTSVVDPRNWKSWSIPPTFGPLNDVQSKILLPTPSGGAWTMIPYPLASGNDPQRLLATFTSTGAATATFQYGGEPMEYNDDGVFVIDMHLRIGQVNTGSGTAGQGVAVEMSFGGDTSFFISYSAGKYRMTDFAGTSLGTWDLNETVNWKLAIYENGAVFSTIYNQSKNSCSVAASTSARVTLDPQDSVPTTTFGLVGSVTATAADAKFGIEAVCGYKRDCVLLTDSYTEAANSPTTAGVVTLWATANRASMNKTSLLLVTTGQSDGNVHGGSTLPYGPNTPRVCPSTSWGRSGNKITDWYTNNIANGALNDWYGTWVFLFGGLTNDINVVTNEATSISVATTLSNAIINTARHRLDRLAGFVWLRTAIPPLRPSASLPSAAFETEWKRDCFYRASALVEAGLIALQRTHARGAYCAIIDGGAHDFDDLTTGIHPGIPGSQAAFVAALPQLGARLGESYMNQGGNAAPGTNAGGGSGRRKILPIPC